MKIAGLTLLGIVAGLICGKLINFGGRGDALWTKGMAIGLITAPIWYPALEEGGLRWPVWGDLPTYVWMLVSGATGYWWASRRQED